MSEDDRSKNHYHAKNCYSPYLLKASRQSNDQNEVNQTDAIVSPDETKSSDDAPARNTRSSTGVGLPTDDEEKICVICGFAKHHNDTKLSRIAEEERASKFLAAYQFNKDAVHRRCVFQNSR